MSRTSCSARACSAGVTPGTPPRSIGFDGSYGFGPGIVGVGGGGAGDVPPGVDPPVRPGVTVAVETVFDVVEPGAVTLAVPVLTPGTAPGFCLPVCTAALGLVFACDFTLGRLR